MRENGLGVDNLTGRTVRLRVPAANRLDETAVAAFRVLKNDIVRRMKETGHGR